jgi:hypothetical protein
VLDELDPPSAAIYVRSDQTEREARETLAALGYDGPTAPIRVARGAASEHTALLVLYDVPQIATEWRAATSGQPARIVALAPPRLLGQIRSLAGTDVAPVSFAAPLDAARAQMAKLRAELRRELAAGTPPHELLAVEPLLEEFDGVALAAAALRLLGHERAARTRLEAAAAAKTIKEPSPRPTERHADRPSDRRPRDDRDTRPTGRGPGARHEGPGGGRPPRDRGQRPPAGRPPGRRPLGPDRPGS